LNKPANVDFPKLRQLEYTKLLKIYKSVMSVRNVAELTKILPTLALSFWSLDITFGFPKIKKSGDISH
jgi:hypothetical protein